MAWRFNEETGELYDDGAGAVDDGDWGSDDESSSSDESEKSWEEEYAELIGVTPDPNDKTWDNSSSPSNDEILKTINADSSGILKKLFTKADGTLDLQAIGGVGGGILGALGALQPNVKRSGYQGSIPKYDAVRNMVTAPPASVNGKPYRPGQGGVNWGGDVSYVPKGTAGSATTATGSAGTGGTGAGSNTDNQNSGLAAALAAKKAGVSYGSGIDQDKNTAEQTRLYTPEYYKPKVDQDKYTSEPEYDGERFYTHEYTDQDQKRDEYLRSMNPTFRADREAEKAKIANLGSTGGEYVGIGDFMRQQTSNLGSVGPVYDLTGQSAIKAGEIMQSNQNSTQQNMAVGGIAGLAKGRYLQGGTDGMADKIPARIGKDQPAALSHGEFVIPADVVSHLGNGNSDAGAKKLYQMMDRIRQARTGTKKQGKKINPDKFMPGGLAQAYASGGSVKRFNTGGTASTTGIGTASSAGVTGSETGPNTWAGEYMSDMLGKTQALTSSPYQQYGGPLTAGESGLQSKVFSGLQNVSFPGNLGSSFSSTGAPTIGADGQPVGGGTSPASQYMNPYLQSVLNPQLAEMRRQNEITNMGANAKFTGAGAFGGGRQAIMNAENNRNMMQEQNKAIGQGYSNAYDKAMSQFNTEQAQGMGLARLMSDQGAQQRGIEAEGIAADKKAFEEARENPYRMLQFQQSMLNGMPISATNIDKATPSALQQAFSGAGGLAGLFPNKTDITIDDLSAALKKFGLDV